MIHPNSWQAGFLVGWYGLFQAVHIFFNAQYLLDPGTPPFPPPEEGWLPQTVHLLNGTTISDLANAVLALVFVYGFFTRARWYLWLGTVTLTISMYAAIVFTVGTMDMGAWTGNVWGYLWSYIPFIPVVLLFVLVSQWAVNEHRPNI